MLHKLKINYFYTRYTYSEMCVEFYTGFIGRPVLDENFFDAFSRSNICILISVNILLYNLWKKL